MAQLIHSLPPNSSVLLLLGEIDCRESILKTVEKAVYPSVDDAIQVLASIYENLIRTLLAQTTRRIYVHPAPPVIDITRPIVRKLNRCDNKSHLLPLLLLLRTQPIPTPSLGTYAEAFGTWSPRFAKR